MLSVPTLFHKLIESGLACKPAFRRVRCYVSAGERLAPRIAADWEKTTKQPIVDAMSCSELVHKIFSNTLSSRRAGSSGRPVPGVEVRLVDADGGEVKGAGRSGRLQVRASFLCACYRLADARYREGIDNFLATLDAQRTFYSAQQALVATRLVRAGNLVDLYRALGGDWNAVPPVASNQMRNQ